ncbi:MAG: hypothetical protein RLZZ148_2745 [Cyanobacteriota bacterium]
MKPTQKKERSWLAFTLLMAITATATPFTPLVKQHLAIAQTAPKITKPAFSLPDTIEAGTKVTIDGSSSMNTINQALKDDFEKTYTGTEVVTGEKGTDVALTELKAGTLDIAAIGRPLTPEEKAAGLIPLVVIKSLSLSVPVIVLIKALPSSNLPKSFGGKSPIGQNLGVQQDRFALLIGQKTVIPVEPLLSTMFSRKNPLKPVPMLKLSKIKPL